MTLQVDGVYSGQVSYRAAKAFRRTSLPGKPPLAWFQAQLELSMGSVEPPPVKVVQVAAPWLANSMVEMLALLVVEQSVPSTEWQTRSQSSGTPEVELLVTALPSSSKAPESCTADAGIAVNAASGRTNAAKAANRFIPFVINFPPWAPRKHLTGSDPGYSFPTSPPRR